MTGTSTRGRNRRDRGYIFLDCVIALMILAVGYGGVVRALSGAINGTIRQNERISERFQKTEQPESVYLFLPMEEEGK